MTGPAGERFYRPELDGLRALAFLGVFGTHVAYRYYGPLPPTAALDPLDLSWWTRGLALGGTFGVDLFFVLSGYLITSLLLREERARGRIDIPAFWMRRILRIWPAYFALLGAAVVLNEEVSGRALAGFATFTANLFPGAHTRSPVDLGILWSIQIEEQFYVLWPLLLVLTPRRFRLGLALGLVVLSIAGRFALAGFGLHVLIVTPGRLDGLGVGALLAMLPLGVAPHRVVKGLGLALPAVAIVGAGLIAHALRVDDPGLSFRPGWGPAGVLLLVPTIVAMSCGFAVWGAAQARWLCWPPLVHLGRISYGLYLIHYSAIAAFASWSWPWAALAAFVTSVLVAEVSYRLLERPFLKLKERFARVVSRSDTRGVGPIGDPSPRIRTSDVREPVT